jgi:hypothetical protein
MLLLNKFKSNIISLAITIGKKNSKITLKYYFKNYFKYDTLIKTHAKQ